VVQYTFLHWVRICSKSSRKKMAHVKFQTMNFYEHVYANGQ
jgi:hypothetical protein